MSDTIRRICRSCSATVEVDWTKDDAACARCKAAHERALARLEDAITEAIASVQSITALDASRAIERVMSALQADPLTAPVLKYSLTSVLA